MSCGETVVLERFVKSNLKHCWLASIGLLHWYMLQPLSTFMCSQSFSHACSSYHGLFSCPLCYGTSVPTSRASLRCCPSCTLHQLIQPTPLHCIPTCFRYCVSLVDPTLLHLATTVRRQCQQCRSVLHAMTSTCFVDTLCMPIKSSSVSASRGIGPVSTTVFDDHCCLPLPTCNPAMPQSVLQDSKRVSMRSICRSTSHRYRPHHSTCCPAAKPPCALIGVRAARAA